MRRYLAAGLIGLYVMWISSREAATRNAAFKLIRDHAREQQELHEWMYKQRWGNDA